MQAFRLLLRGLLRFTHKNVVVTKGDFLMNCLQLDIARQKESLSFIDDYFKKAKNWGYDTVILYLENAVRTSVTANFSVDETYSKEEIGQIVGFG